MLGNYYFPVTSSTDDINSATGVIYQAQQQNLSTRAMDKGHHQEPLGSSPPRASSSLSGHPVKLPIRSLIDPISSSEGEVNPDDLSPTRSPRRRSQWKNGNDTDSEAGASLRTATDDQTTLVDMKKAANVETRPSPPLAVRLTMEAPSLGATSMTKVRRRRSFTKQEHNEDRERRKSLRTLRTSSASEMVENDAESSVTPVAPPQRIRLRSPKRRSPSPRRETLVASPRTKRDRLARGREIEGEGLVVRISRSPLQKKSQSQSPATRVRGRLRSRSPRRTSAGTALSSSLRSSPVKAIATESTRTSPNQASPSRPNPDNPETAVTNKIRIRLRPSLEASSTENMNGAGEATARNRKDNHENEPDTKKRTTPKESRHSKRSPPRRKNVARDVARKSNRRVRLSKAANDTSPSKMSKKSRDSPRKREVETSEIESPSVGGQINGLGGSPSERLIPPASPKTPGRGKNHPSQPAPSSSPRSLVNNEFCSACAGAGTLICCESCPRSFHFLCADPPIDPENVPDENWFCDECRWARTESSQESALQDGVKMIATVPKELWTHLRDYVTRLNPKIFTLPKRIRKLTNDDDAAKALGVEPDDEPPRPSGADSTDLDASTLHKPLHHYHPHKERLSSKGYCHHCGQGATMEENRLLINCDDCTLKWHLDCLPYPLAVYPSGHRHWACPVHLTRYNLAHLPPNTVQQILERSREASIKITDWSEKPLPRTELSILPEAAVRLHFGWSTAGLFNGQSQTNGRYGGCSVPETVKQSYAWMRTTSAHEAKLLRYYEAYDYMDRGMETNMVI